ncbi:hypothetical protein QPM17_12060 [Marinobacter sp. TBZ242]|uniref:Flp pilus-assembly TadG-like N-terminal domain-containing protein n=1 Tax=Marinobacter azerbaijanicus TaxID=3050455 RepID=A0ABT7ICJ7_9GAMM|nr:hypothetical protein [Marinobacter sp. TBZ242]MDL0431869.1 hypothetical protein [Marinobacter sp. TBZ242]
MVRINSLRSQRGALIFVAPLAVSVIVLMMVLAVDGARLLALQSEMQNQVNAAASAAADGAQACGGPDVEMTTISSRALDAAKAAGYDGADDALSVIPGVLESTDENTDLVFRRVPESALNRSNGVRVSITREEPISKLFPGGLFGTVTLERSAAVRKEVNAMISAVSSAADIEGGLLGGLIGAVLGDPSYSLSPTQLDSLEDTLINVGDLLERMGVNDVADLVDEPLVDLLTEVTGLVGGSAQPAGMLVDDLTAAAGISGLYVSDVLEVVEGTNVSSDASFPLYDLVISTVMNSARVLSGSGSLLGLDLDTSESTLLQGLVSSTDELANLEVDLGLHVADAPKMVYGPARQDADGQWVTRVRSADIRLEAIVSAGLSKSGINSLVSTLSLGLVDIDLLDNIVIPLAVQAGGGSASLVSGECAVGGNDNDVSLGFDMIDTAADVETGRVDPATGLVNPEPVQAEILEAKLLGVSVAKLCADVGLAIDLYSESVSPSVIENYPLQCLDGECASRKATSDGFADEFSSDVTVTSLSLTCDSSSDLTTLMNTLLVPVTDVVSEVVESLVAPLLASLGVNPGNMSVTVVNANQNTTQLVENVSIVEQ